MGKRQQEKKQKEKRADFIYLDTYYAWILDEWYINSYGNLCVKVKLKRIDSDYTKIAFVDEYFLTEITSCE